LGLVREGEGIAAGVLHSFGITLEQVRWETLAVLSKAVPKPAQGPVQEDVSTTHDVGAAEPGAVPNQGPLQDEDDRVLSILEIPKADLLNSPSGQACAVILSRGSQRFQHNYIGTEHLLLGLVREQEALLHEYCKTWALS